jgi:hypothetical protein
MKRGAAAATMIFLLRDSQFGSSIEISRIA